MPVPHTHFSDVPVRPLLPYTCLLLIPLVIQSDYSKLQEMCGDEKSSSTYHSSSSRRTYDIVRSASTCELVSTISNGSTERIESKCLLRTSSKWILMMIWPVNWIHHISTNRFIQPLPDPFHLGVIWTPPRSTLLRKSYFFTRRPVDLCMVTLLCLLCSRL